MSDMIWVGVSVRVEEDELHIIFPRDCSDLLIHWKKAWELGQLIGTTAYAMRPKPSDPGQDEAEADFVRFGIYENNGVIIYLREARKKLTFNRGSALVMAEKLCEVAEEVGAKFQKNIPNNPMFSKPKKG